MAPPSPGEQALSAHDLPKMESLFREEAHTPGEGGERAHSNLIRILLQRDAFTEADDDAEAWVAASPSSTWAKVSLFEVQWRRGEVAEDRDTLVAANRMDPCNPRVFQDFARLLRFSGSTRPPETCSTRRTGWTPWTPTSPSTG